MAHRAQKSGIALDAQQKMNSKWDPERTRAVVAWVGRSVGVPLDTDGSMEDVHEKFLDGVILAKLANFLKPGSIPESKYLKAPTMAFKRMELIGMFLNVLDEANGGAIKKDDLFQTVDLYEKQNLVQFILTLEAVGRHAWTIGREGFGKAESKGEQRVWTEAELNAGKNIIGLQMGSNKGATQAGQNFGKSRDIMS